MTTPCLGLPSPMLDTRRSGLLVVLEGIDGAGTTTQARRLQQTLTKEGRDCHLTKEPSTGPVGRLLREILTGKHAPTDATTLGLLFAADRADHLQREVLPALARGAVVISDRWYHSSLAYQGTDEDRRWIRELNRRARAPELTVFVDVRPEVAAERRRLANREDELFDAIETQTRVAIGYKKAIEWLKDHEHIVTIDGERSLDEIESEILRLVRENLPD